MRCEVLHLNAHFPVLNAEGRDPTLEIFLPHNMSEMNQQDQKRPCMLILPGGGYGMVSSREGEPIAMHLLPEGYNVFVLSYSVAPHRFPVQLTEVAAAMELIYENGEAWNCDTSRIAIMGFSAGGHLAAHYTTCYACDPVRAVFPQSKPVQASVLCYPVITADPQHAHQGSLLNLLGRYPETEEELTFFSCEKQVSGNTPPTFLWHTAEDDLVPVMNSLLYAQALSRHNVPYELHIYPHGWHGLATGDRQTNAPLPAEFSYVKDWMPAMRQWLNATFQHNL